MEDITLGVERSLLRDIISKIKKFTSRETFCENDELKVEIRSEVESYPCMQGEKKPLKIHKTYVQKVISYFSPSSDARIYRSVARPRLGKYAQG